MRMHATACQPLAHGRLRGIGWAFAMATIVLAACGGAPEEPLVVTPAPKVIDPIPVPTTPTPAPSPTLLAGLYKGAFQSNLNREFLALVVPEAGKTVHVYGWYYNAADLRLAHLYEGQLELGVEGNAANVPQSWRVIEGASNYPAAASVATATLNQLLADLSISRNSVSNYRLKLDALPQAGYDFNVAPMDLSNSRWNGFWSSINDTAEGRLQFGSNSALDTSDTLWSCLSGGAATWKWTAQSLNFFKVTVSLGSMTLCPEWQKHKLEGVATVSKQNGVYQLDMMLLDGTGAGISYRGTR